MFIKSLILDGFKSYGTRTEIKGFDPEFNAITGLNGTGKSNILDSICFVLGISNLSNVRATNLVDLIYKSGQAGVTKATVSVLFDNSDPTKSPINYEHHKEIIVSRQIVVGGKNRYMINGTTVTNKHIVDFFNSVQLNVNNPHFLIMQGRITKVLNMKPPEILSMIEEAAGTSMYENKKLAARKTVEKKDTRLKEMNEMVSEQINPKMQRLKDDRSQYMEFQKIQREYESLSRISVAYYFITTESTLEKENTRMLKLQEELKMLEESKEDHLKEIKKIEEEVNIMRKKLDDEKGGSLQSLMSLLKEKESAEAKSKAQLKSIQESISSAVRKQKQLEKGLRDDEKALQVKSAEMAKAETVFGTLREAEKADAEALAAAEKKYQAVSSGLLSNDDGQDASLQDQLMAAKEQLTEAETEIKQCNLQISHNKKELAVKQPKLKETETSYASDSKELQLKEKQLASLQGQLRKHKYEEGLMEKLQDNLREINRDLKHCSDQLYNFSSRYPQLRFDYKDPEPNFDRRQVRGLICNLFTLKDDKFARALETVAGGKLYNVVVNNENVSSKLIKNGHLTKRVTFAPLNKIHSSRMNQNVLKIAQKLVGPENVFLAQSLINYDPEYESVMSWVFGQTLICTNMDHAMAVCYNKQIQKKAVSLEGDVFDPAGVISGGAEVRSDPILAVLIEVKKNEKELGMKQKQQKQVMDQLSAASEVAALANNFKIMEEELEMIKRRVEQTAHYQLKSEIEELKSSIDAKTNRINECNVIIKEKRSKVSELEGKMKNLKSIREKELKAAEAELKRVQKQAEDSRNKWKIREQEFETLQMEINELETAVTNSKEELRKGEELISQTQKELTEFKAEMANIQSEVKRLKEEVKTEEEEIGKKNKEIQIMMGKKDKLEKQINEFDLTKVSNGLNQKEGQEEIKKLNSIMKELKKKHPWIETDRQYFGQPNGLYDFEANNPNEVTAKMKKISEMKEKLGKSVNAKALEVLGNQEEQFQDVLSKKMIVEEDRSKILSVIEELDVRKEEVIQTAWEQVNTDFNSIFETLLPGSHAKLQPVDGKDFMKGLQIKVGFGGIWKDSLDELSGGQRSLVALSFILAMLLFKPAPLYILDEVDAALDQSHTQNIGLMLKKHFTQSQFIVVSLKDGMFSNANVLFRTSFVEGMSTVIRTTPKNK